MVPASERVACQTRRAAAVVSRGFELGVRGQGAIAPIPPLGWRVPAREPGIEPIPAGAGLEPLGERLPENPPERLVPDVRRLAVDAAAAAHHRGAAPPASHVEAVRPSAHRARAYVLAAPVAQIEPGRPILDVGQRFARGHGAAPEHGQAGAGEAGSGLREGPTPARLCAPLPRGICFGARSCPRRPGRDSPDTVHPAAARDSSNSRRRCACSAARSAGSTTRESSQAFRSAPR